MRECISFSMRVLIVHEIQTRAVLVGDFAAEISRISLRSNHVRKFDGATYEIRQWRLAKDYLQMSDANLHRLEFSFSEGDCKHSIGPTNETGAVLVSFDNRQGKRNMLVASLRFELIPGDVGYFRSSYKVYLRYR